MLVWRIVLSLALSSILAGLFWFDHHRGEPAVVLLAFTLFLAARGSFELVELLRIRNLKLAYPLPLAGSLLVVTAGWAHTWIPSLPSDSLASATLMSLGIVGMAVAASVLMLFIFRAIRYRQPGDNMQTLSAELSVVCYIGLLLAVTAQLRWVAGAPLGYYALASLIVAAKTGDIGAYIFGKNIGGPKMVPLLSPAKTWAGAAGSIVGSILGGAAWMYLALPNFDQSAEPGHWYWIVLYSGVIGLMGMVGDLCESLIKRDVERKDSAPLMPGFGGLLDLLDSVIFAGPVAVLMWLIIPLIEH